MTTIPSAIQKTLRIIVVDDHPIIRNGMLTVINSAPDMEVVGSFGDGQSAVQAAGTLRPDLVVMDITMPILDGISATEQITSENSAVYVVGLTARENSSFICRFLEAGAAGIIHKLSGTQDMLEALRIVASGGVYIDPAFRRILGHSHPSIADILRRRKLSPREESVLRYIAEGMSNMEIASALGISVKTVETYKTRFVKKLGLRSRADIVTYAVAEGWIGNASYDEDSSAKAPARMV